MNSLKRYRVGRRELPFSVVRRVNEQGQRLPEGTPIDDGELSWLMGSDVDDYERQCWWWDHVEKDWRDDETWQEFEARQRPARMTATLGERAA